MHLSTASFTFSFGLTHLSFITGDWTGLGEVASMSHRNLKSTLYQLSTEVSKALAHDKLTTGKCTNSSSGMAITSLSGGHPNPQKICSPAPPAAPTKAFMCNEQELDGTVCSTDSSEEACNMTLYYNFQDWELTGKKQAWYQDGWKPSPVLNLSTQFLLAIGVSE